jgi:CBS domain-containing protein
MTTCEALMSTALITAKPEDTIDAADFDMKLADIRHVPVVDDRNKLVGIVSNRDLLLALGAAVDNRVKIREVMSKTLHTVSTSDPAHTAVELMLDNKINCIPVLGDKRQLVGLITATDFLRVAHAALTGEMDYS